MSAPDKLKVFISYSRADAKFADELVAGLEFKDEIAVTIDRHSIIEGEDWKKRLGALIADADTIAFILSPDSAQSPICGWEVEEAHRLSKRILPVLAKPLDGISAPTLLAALNYVRFDEDRSFMGGLLALVRALKTDVDWLREHTRLLTLAMSWDAAQRPANRLLSGTDIAAAKEWLATRPKDAPDATLLHLDFLRASELAENERRSAERAQLAEMAAAQSQRSAALQEREAAVRRLQMWTRRGIAAAAAGAAGGAGLGYWGYDAERRVRVEQENTRKAAAEALEADIKAEAWRTDIAGQLVALASSPGKDVLDGAPGENSPFTKALIEDLSVKTTSFQSALARASRNILQISQGKQRPFMSTNLTGEVYFHRQPLSRERTAIIISVSELGGTRLPNVEIDATAWQRLLSGAGFKVARLRDPRAAEIRRALEGQLRETEFRRGDQVAERVIGDSGQFEKVEQHANPNSLTVMYFAGFGTNIDDQNFILGIDGENTSKQAVQLSAIALAEVLALLRQRASASIAIMDTGFLQFEQSTR